MLGARSPMFGTPYQDTLCLRCQEAVYGRLSSFRVYRFDTVCVCQRGLVSCACKVRNTRRLEAQLGVSVVRGAEVCRFIKGCISHFA